MPEKAKIPEYLGKCEILHVHDDGDLTIKCAGRKYVVTTEGEVFKEVKKKLGVTEMEDKKYECDCALHMVKLVQQINAIEDKRKPLTELIYDELKHDISNTAGKCSFNPKVTDEEMKALSDAIAKREQKSQDYIISTLLQAIENDIYRSCMME